MEAGDEVEGEWKCVEVVGAERIHSARYIIKNTYTHNHTTISEGILSDAKRKGRKVRYTTIEFRALG